MNEIHIQPVKYSPTYFQPGFIIVQSLLSRFCALYRIGLSYKTIQEHQGTTFSVITYELTVYSMNLIPTRLEGLGLYLHDKQSREHFLLLSELDCTYSDCPNNLFFYRSHSKDTCVTQAVSISLLSQGYFKRDDFRR